ncbi:glucose-1-phosphate adenylyltransferase subunit GlgD [Clostridia bacterium]|nr:glucose-1-phosphate adenylyltransferase subunit GlgD [Clostridia bacterium]
MAGMGNVLGLVFASMHDLTITDLTKLRTMSSVPFGARYRLIDFTLSNMVNSGINEIGVVTKSNYQSLLDHLGSGAEWDLNRKNGGLQILPPYGHAGGGLYRGRLDALSGVYDYISESTADYVLMSDCDVVVNLDLRAALEYHKEKKADITIIYGKGNYTAAEMLTKTVLEVKDDGQVYDVLVRPDKAGEFNTSMNLFFLKRDFLLELIKETTARNLYSFEVDVIQHKLNDFRIFGYKYSGYYEQIDSVTGYFKANMALMDKAKRTELFNDDRLIYTKIRDEAPAKYGIEANASNSLVADGCVIEGNVENCVLFRGVKIGKGAVVKNSILMQDTIVGDKCELNYVIADKDVRVGAYRSMYGAPDYPVFISKGAEV